ncbi:MAG: ABC transporter permease [Candidatus Curtissbacteria bacterium]|nr:ABC transporter permease [Candidatus Curtissbacteria bacterium]
MKKWFLELWKFRELLWVFTLKEIKIRYKQTILGVAWAILQPAALTIIFTVIFGLFLKVHSENIPYPIFAYSALLPWTFFSTAVSFGALSVVNNSGLVTKIYFPKEVLPLSAIGAAFFDFLMASLIFILMMFIYKIPITLNILFVFILIPATLLFAIGISFFLSAINVLFRDIRFVVPLVLQVWLYLTPVIYSFGQIPEKYRVLISLNPLVGLIQGFRDVTVLGKMPDLNLTVFSLVVSLAVFFLGYWFFKSKESIFADVI